MATAWVNFNNGDTGFAVRTALNTFNTGISTNMSSAETRLTDTETATSGNTSAITALDGRVTTAEADIVALETPISVTFDPQTVAPAHTAGQAYYDGNTGSFKLQGPISGVEVDVGHSMHIHVVNNSGAILEKGMAVRHDGIAAGKIQVIKAIATSFDNARIFGVVQEDIAIGADGAIVTFGEITGVNTLGTTTGVPLYLSDTVAGTWVETPPNIVSRIGGALTADALTGRLFVYVINNLSLPTVLGGLQGHTPGNEVYAVTTTTQDVNDYLTETSVVLPVDALTGVIGISNDGEYRLNFAATLTFPSLTSTRSVTIEFYDITGATIIYEYTKNIPRDATVDSLSFGYPFSQVAGRQYKMRIRASTDISVTFNSVSFDIESVNIR